MPDLSDPFPVPVAVLKRRVVSRGVRAVQQGLIRWSSLPSSLATWENLEALRQQFPLAPAWGQAGAHGGGDVSNTKGKTDDPIQQESPPREDAEKNQDKRPKRMLKPNVKLAGPEWVN